MKRLIIFALLIGSAFAGTLIVIPGKGYHGSPVTLQSFSNTFDTDTSASWTAGAGTFSITSGVMNVTTGAYAENVFAYTATACATVNQYVRVEAIIAGGSQYPYVLLRYTNASSPMYVIFFNSSGDQAGWTRKATASDATGTTVGAATALTVDTGDVFGVTISGTGTTTVRVWRNPTGNTPTSASDWGGDTTPDITWSTSPSSPVDTGNYVGLGGLTNSSLNVAFDDFFGGDTP